MPKHQNTSTKKQFLNSSVAKLSLQLILLVVAYSSNFLLPHAKANPIDEVGEQLIIKGAALINMGYRLTHEPIINYLSNRSSTVHHLNLYAGKSYVIIGSCDGDCGDIDLRLIDFNGRIIDYDMEVDDDPMVRAYVYTTGRFRTEVIMSRCSVSPCMYSLGVFGK
jgi:hypothetical protein